MSAPGRAELVRGLAWLGLAGAVALWARPPRAELATAGRAPPGPAVDGQEGQDGPDERDPPPRADHDRGPGDEHPEDAEGTSGLRGYTIGLGLALLLTLASFGLPATGLVWGPAVPAALIVFALAQVGVHLVFFLHLTTGPDNTNNAMALAFGVLVVGLLIGGTLWIMAHLDANMMPMAPTMDMRR